MSRSLCRIKSEILILQIVKNYHMIKKYAIGLAMTTAVMGFWGCNSSSDSTYETVMPSSVMVTAFSLAENDSVLENLDSIYFSIDLVNAKIFNADSLPYGTNVSRLIVNITTSGVGAANLKFKSSETTDSVVDYLTNSTDSIDFSYGPATLSLTAYDGVTTRDYEIKVNVHQVKPDSLVWSQVAKTKLPTTFSAVGAQKTTQMAGTLYCLTKSSSNYCLASTDDPGANSWTTKSVSFGFTPNVESFNATNDALYILSSDGTLYKSSDEGQSWSSCGVEWNNIYGGYQDRLLGNKKSGSTYTFETYPASQSVELSEDFPVSGTSEPLSFDVEWAVNPQIIIAGGCKADGSYSGDTWGYDGETWVNLTVKPFPVGLKGIAVFPYFTYVTDTTNWAVTEYTTLYAIGGQTAQGTVNGSVYVSKDYGMTWNEADVLLQLPDYIPAMYSSQAFVYKSTLTSNSRSTSDWISMPSRDIPGYLQMPVATSKSRVSTPITEWECPYVYLFGGVSASGVTYNTVWRGVINRLTFKPIQ